MLDTESLSKCWGHLREQTLVIEHGTDRYGRTIGRLKVGEVGANEEQVRRGMAWACDRYVKDQSLYTFQDAAKAAKRGLWADSRHVPPWEWRQAKRANSKATYPQ